MSLYGHGLLGDRGEVNGDLTRKMSADYNIAYCATDWYGFAEQNIPNVLLILQNLSLFPLLADETQQGMLNFLYLGRLMIHPSGLTTNAAFQDPSGHSVLNTSRLFYDGNSQGGILGGALTAVAPDFNRAVLGVPGMNYSTLLQRSVDFEPYAEGNFNSAICGLFPSPLDTICNPGCTGDGLASLNLIGGSDPSIAFTLDVPTPEPTTLLFFATMAPGLLIAAWRRRRG